MAGWFGPKRFGYGIGPRGWQGWLATALLLGGAVLDAKFFRPQAFGLQIWTRPASAILLGLCFLAVIWLKYEPND
jgi:hypothetical protein